MAEAATVELVVLTESVMHDPVSPPAVTEPETVTLPLTSSEQDPVTLGLLTASVPVTAPPLFGKASAARSLAALTAVDEAAMVELVVDTELLMHPMSPDAFTLPLTFTSSPAK